MVKVTQVCFGSSLETIHVAAFKKSEQRSEVPGEVEGNGKRQKAAGQNRIKNFHKQVSRMGRSTWSHGNIRKTIIRDGQEWSQETKVYSQINVFCSRCFVHDNNL